MGPTMSHCLVVARSLVITICKISSAADSIHSVGAELLSVHAAAPAAATEDGDDVVSNGWWVSYSF